MVKNKREKGRYIRELIIMAIALTIVGLTVSYAAVNATLDIAGISAVRVANWNIKFDSTKVISKTGSATVVQEPKISGLSIHYEVRLEEVGDSVTVKAVVKNDGNMDAKLESFDIFGLPSQYKDNISYKVTDEDGDFLAKGTVLKGSKVENEEDRYMTVYITITYENTIYDTGDEYEVFNLGLSLNYVQNL